jgi:hypothetical protein
MVKQKSSAHSDRNMKEYKMRTPYNASKNNYRQNPSKPNRVQVAHSNGSCCSSSRQTTFHHNQLLFNLKHPEKLHMIEVIQGLIHLIHIIIGKLIKILIEIKNLIFNKLVKIKFIQLDQLHMLNSQILNLILYNNQHQQTKVLVVQFNRKQYFSFLKLDFFYN